MISIMVLTGRNGRLFSFLTDKFAPRVKSHVRIRVVIFIGVDRNQPVNLLGLIINRSVNLIDIDRSTPQINDRNIKTCSFQIKYVNMKEMALETEFITSFNISYHLLINYSCWNGLCK